MAQWQSDGLVPPVERNSGNVVHEITERTLHFCSRQLQLCQVLWGTTSSRSLLPLQIVHKEHKDGNWLELKIANYQQELSRTARLFFHRPLRVEQSPNLCLHAQTLSSFKSHLKIDSSFLCLLLTSKCLKSASSKSVCVVRARACVCVRAYVCVCVCWGRCGQMLMRNLCMLISVVQLDCENVHARDYTRKGALRPHWYCYYEMLMVSSGLILTSILDVLSSGLEFVPD